MFESFHDRKGELFVVRRFQEGIMSFPLAVFPFRKRSAQCAPKLHIQYRMGTVELSLTARVRQAEGAAIGLTGVAKPVIRVKEGLP